MGERGYVTPWKTRRGSGPIKKEEKNDRLATCKNDRTFNHVRMRMVLEHLPGGGKDKNRDLKIGKEGGMGFEKGSTMHRGCERGTERPRS